MQNQQNIKIADRIAALQQSSQYPVNRRTNLDTNNVNNNNSKLSVKGRAARFSQFDNGKPLEPVRHLSLSNSNNQIIGNRIPRSSTGGNLTSRSQYRKSYSDDSEQNIKQQRRKSEDIGMLNSSRLSIMSDQSSQSVPSANMFKANSAMLSELLMKNSNVYKSDNDKENVDYDNVHGKDDDKDKESGVCTVVSTSRSPTPNNSSNNITNDNSQKEEEKEKSLPSLVVVPPHENKTQLTTPSTSTNRKHKIIKRERETNINYDNYNGFNYIKSINDKRSSEYNENEGEGDVVDMDFNPTPLDQRFNFISLTEPQTKINLEPKLDNDKPPSSKSRISTSESIPYSNVGSYKSNKANSIKGKVKNLFSGKRNRRRTLDENYDKEILKQFTSSDNNKTHQNYSSKTLPAVRAIEPMNITLPTSEDIEKREENERLKKENESRRLKKHEDEQKRINELKLASKSKPNQKLTKNNNNNNNNNNKQINSNNSSASNSKITENNNNASKNANNNNNKVNVNDKKENDDENIWLQTVVNEFN